MSNSYMFTSSFSAIMPPPPPVSLICIKSLMAFWSPAITFGGWGGGGCSLRTICQDAYTGLRWLSIMLKGTVFPHVYVCVLLTNVVSTVADVW